ncbi:MAG TPA: DUF4236 domain-containing protein [Acidimicrobiia bacterium]|nr:DUF4236 domain-containing protein [Acidimicrobiia bacterium]
MALRFFRRVKLAPGVHMNLSRPGPSFSFGMRGAQVTVGSRDVRRTVGLPGTGLFYTSTSGTHTGTHTSEQFAHRSNLLGKLDDLHRAGLLTDEEHAAKRAALLGHASG